MRSGVYSMEFKRHFTSEDVEALFDGSFSLPEDFLFGVSSSGYKTEGGFNGQGELLNNWVDLERSGKVERSGEANRFWKEYPEQVELAKSIGLNAFRMGIEWARVQPSATRSPGKVPPFDQAAIEGYSNIIAQMRKSGLEPMVTLYHFIHPEWLGEDFWLHREKMELFEQYVREFADKVNVFLIEKHGEQPVKLWLTMNEPNGMAMLTYLVGAFPHKEFGIHPACRAWGNLINAHCRAYDAIHDLYRDRGWEKPMVTFNTMQQAIYLLDKVTTDILNCRRNGVERADLESYLEDGRAKFDEEVAKCPVVSEAPWINKQLERVIKYVSTRVWDIDDFESGIDAIYSSPEKNKMDYHAVDYYDPFRSLVNMLNAPTIQDLREKRFSLVHAGWEWVLNPRGLYHFLKAECINGEGLPILIVESGMAYKVCKGMVEARRDDATRDVFLETHLFEAMRALKDGVPLAGYFIWTLVDDYEWGSYMPRYGLYTVDRTRTPAKIGTRDAWGLDSGKVYSDLIAALRSRDREAIVEAFTKDYV
jgi:beta-glucosidase